MYKLLGTLLRELREKHGWTLEELTGRLGDIRGADSSGIQRIESGKKKAPLELYAALASVFEMPLSELIATAEQRSGKSGNILIEDEENLVGFYRTMEPDQQSVYRELARVMTKKTC